MRQEDKATGRDGKFVCRAGAKTTISLTDSRGSQRNSSRAEQKDRAEPELGHAVRTNCRESFVPSKAKFKQDTEIS